jgi:hypothetical protein
MKVCEVCGSQEEWETEKSDFVQTTFLHICEQCQSDRKFEWTEKHSF